MEKISMNKISIAGIMIRTTNENKKAAADIPALWKRFRSENISAQLPHKTDETIYCVYTDYESDHTKPYTVLLGYQVPSIENIPDGLTAKTFESGSYMPFKAEGNLAEGIVYQAWLRIWESDISRAYTADFEVYSEKASRPEQAVVDILISITS